MIKKITGEEIDVDEGARYAQNEAQIRELVDTICPTICNKVDEWMGKRSNGYLEALFQLADTLKMKQWMCRDEAIFVFVKMCHVSKMEQQYNLEPVISKFHSMEEMKRVYQRTVFYIRRIELKLPKELCEDFYALVEEWNFSPYYIWEGIILEKRAVYDISALTEEIITGLTMHGRREDADIIYAAACNLCVGE